MTHHSRDKKGKGSGCNAGPGVRPSSLSHSLVGCRSPKKPVVRSGPSGQSPSRHKLKHEDGWKCFHWQRDSVSLLLGPFAISVLQGPPASALHTHPCVASFQPLPHYAAAQPALSLQEVTQSLPQVLRHPSLRMHRCLLCQASRFRLPGSSFRALYPLAPPPVLGLPRLLQT